MASTEKIPGNGESRNMVRESSARGLMARARELVRSSSSRIVATAEVGKDLTERRSLKEAGSRRETTGRRGSGLGASSCHETRLSSSSTRSRRGMPNHVSSDNMESVQPSRQRDDLAAATMHGHGNISRVRNHRKSTTENETVSQRKSGVDRRSHMKRAMSRENVKPPEEYGPPASNPSKNMGLYGGNSPQPRRGRRRPVKAEEEEDNDEVVPVDHLVESSDDDFGADDSDEDSFAFDEELPKQPPKRSSNLLRKKVPPTRSRDLLSLLRDNKTVQLTDMEDKGNRRILHFFMYQHTLGIDLNELQASVDQDFAMNGSEALRRPPLPLYVEPAN